MSSATEGRSGPAAFAMKRSASDGLTSMALNVSKMSMCIVGPA
jgi:hypothetical protein